MPPLPMPPKEVGAVNTIKTDLQKVIEKFSKIGSANSLYMELYDKIRNLLNKLGKLDINVATLYVTKIGKLMTKYERELPKELSDIAKENNTKWKLLLTAHREELKKKKFVKKNEVPVKEEPLSQDSYNDLIASQESSDDTEDSYNLLLASQDFDPSEVETGNEFLTSTPMEQGTEKNNSNSDTVQNKTIDVTSKGFLIDMRDVVSNLTNSLSSVEGECTRMKTMIEYINDKLNDYEKTLSLQNSVSTSKNNPIKETFEKTGRAVMPRLLKPSPSKNCSDAAPISTQSANPIFTPVNRVARIAKETERSRNTKEMSNIQSMHKEKSPSKDNSLEKTSKSVSPNTVSSSKNDKKMNDKSIPNGNIANKSTSFTKTNACVITTCTSTFASYEVEENEDINPCTSSADMDETLPYPLPDITIKQEEPDMDNSQDIEFFRHRDDIVAKSSSKRDHSFSTSENIPVKNTGDLKKCPSQKLKRKSFEDDVVPAKVVSNKDKESIQDKISCISQNLKRRSIEERESFQKSKANSPERQVSPESKSHSKSSKFHAESTKSYGESSSSCGELSKNHGKSSKSTVFDIDSDGFAIPKIVNQNEVQLSDDTILLKGDSMEEISKLLEGYMLEDDNECHTEVSESSDESCLLPSAQNNNPTTKRKRRLAGYNSFYRHIMSERVKNGPMVDFGEMSKLAANEWKKLDLDARKEWRIKGWDEKEKLQCDKCERSFKREKDMKYHWRRCGACVCKFDGCAKEFSSQEGLRRHSKVHNKTYICKVCDKSFPSSTGLKRHMFIHEGKRFSCSSCPQTYSSKANLLRHIRSVHE